MYPKLLTGSSLNSPISLHEARFPVSDVSRHALKTIQLIIATVIKDKL